MSWRVPLVDRGPPLEAYFSGRVGSGQRCCWPLNADLLGGLEKFVKYGFSLLLLIVSLCGCTLGPWETTERYEVIPEGPRKTSKERITTTQEPRTTPKGRRIITLDGAAISEETARELVSWVCRDFFGGGKILVEVGKFSDPYLDGSGFVIYDGGDSGEATQHRRKGINLRWDWGPNGNDFAFVIKPDGVGSFYDFTHAKGETIKADQMFKCRRR